MGHFLQSVRGVGKIKLSRTWIFILFPVFLAACKKNENTSAGYSEAFQIIFNKVNYYSDHNQQEKGLHYLDSSFAKIHNPSVDDRFRFYGFHYNYWYNTKQDYKKSLPYGDSMLMMAQKSITRQQYASNFAEGNYAKGDAYFGLKQYNDAYQCYFQGYFVAKNYLQQASLADFTYRMGMIMFKQEHYKLAAEYFKESYRQSASRKDDFAAFYRKQELLDNIAISYRSNGDLDSALQYFDRDTKYINANRSKFKAQAGFLDIAKGVIDGNKAEILMLRGQNAAARELLRSSIAVNLRKGGDNKDAEYTEIKLAYLYNASHKNDSLFMLLKDLRAQLDTVRNEEAEADWNRLMGNYYYNKKDLEKAIIYTRQYNVLKDSVIKRLSALKETDVNQQLANLEKQYEIDGLNNNAKLQKIYLSVAIVCAAMLLLIIALVWRNWRQSKFDIQVSIALNRQISEQKVNLEKALDDVKFSSQEKDRILRAVAHDLRNPLGGIASLTAVMVEECEGNKELADQVKLIKETANDSLELINEILEATNSELVSMSRQWVEINSLIYNSVELLRFKAAEKHQQILVDGLSNDTELHINREKIWRVISNLISNAIKFSPVDSVIMVNAIQKQNNIIISVKDHGIGIPDNMKDKVFNMFTNAKRPGTIGEKSFGLGLSISKQIIEKHQGTIWFESEQNKGAIFYVSLPKTPKKNGQSQKSSADKQLIIR